MIRKWTVGLVTVVCLPLMASANDDAQQLLVTFKNDKSSYQSASFQAPYRARKRYAVSASIQRQAKAIAQQHLLIPRAQWPLRSLSVYCYVFDVPPDRLQSVIAALSKDARVESVQALNQFKTQSSPTPAYDDEYVAMQHSLDTISLTSAHRYSRGEGVRVAVVDSDADHRHEDLRGALKRTDYLEHGDLERDRRHGTAVASVIGARANNALGIVGVAPAASLEVAEACWRDRETERAICDTFSLARALDAMVDAPPDVINLSLCGPDDALLRRILAKLIDGGAVVVAAVPSTVQSESAFPASMAGVIAVATIGASENNKLPGTVYAPGEQILVAVPSDDYEFKSGSSLATAHVSGIVALLKAQQPTMAVNDVRDVLLQSSLPTNDERIAVNACHALAQFETSIRCD